MYNLGPLDIIILVLGLINFFRLSILTVLTVVYDKYFHRQNFFRTLNTSLSKENKILESHFYPKISVVIAAYNEEKVIERTLGYLFQSTYKNFEVIVVNDGSKDKTEECVKRFIATHFEKPITYVYQTNKGKAHALNNAINNYITGELMMCLDADSILTSDALEKCVKYFRNTKVKALATNVKILNELSVLGLVQKLEYLMGYHLKKALTVGNIEYIIGGVGSVFRSSVVKELGGYDTDTVTEDIDLTMKVVRLGNKENLLVYAEDVVVFTEGTLSLKALFKQRFRWKFGRFQTFWKNRDLFFNKDKKYSRYLTIIYLPFQLFSEAVFLFDPVFIFYILYLSIRMGNFASYYGMFIFMMFYVAIAVATDYMSSAKERVILLLLSPFSYPIFFIVSIVEYAGLLKCIVKWKEIIYAKEFNRCGWTPVERLGKNNIKIS